MIASICATEKLETPTALTFPVAGNLINSVQVSTKLVSVSISTSFSFVGWGGKNRSTLFLAVNATGQWITETQIYQQMNKHRDDLGRTVQVKVAGPELLEGLIELLFNLSRFVGSVPKLGCDEQVLALAHRWHDLFESCPNLVLAATASQSGDTYRPKITYFK